MAGGQASLTAEEVAVAAIDRPLGAAPFVLICEHASNAFPSRYGTLGLTAAERESHIAWDRGALAVAQRLSTRLDAPLIHATISRLVIDLNRDPEAPDSIAAVSESTAVAGNAGLATAARAERVAAVYRPFHDAVDRFLGARRAPTRAIVSMHSFTPIYRGVARPWHVGLIHDADDRLAMRVAAGLNSRPVPRHRAEPALQPGGSGLPHPRPPRRAARSAAVDDRGPQRPDPRRRRPGCVGRTSRTPDRGGGDGRVTALRRGSRAGQTIETNDNATPAARGLVRAPRRLTFERPPWTLPSSRPPPTRQNTCAAATCRSSRSASSTSTASCAASTWPATSSRPRSKRASASATSCSAGIRTTSSTTM